MLASQPIPIKIAQNRRAVKKNRGVFEANQFPILLLRWDGRDFGSLRSWSGCNRCEKSLFKPENISNRRPDFALAMRCEADCSLSAGGDILDGFKHFLARFGIQTRTRFV